MLMDERSSRLHLFGDQQNPSPTKIVGKVYQKLASITALSIDRDATGKDEADQTASCGVALPVQVSPS